MFLRKRHSIIQCSRVSLIWNRLYRTKVGSLHGQDIGDEGLWFQHRIQIKSTFDLCTYTVYIFTKAFVCKTCTARSPLKLVLSNPLTPLNLPHYSPINPSERRHFFTSASRWHHLDDVYMADHWLYMVVPSIFRDTRHQISSSNIYIYI